MEVATTAVLPPWMFTMADGWQPRNRYKIFAIHGLQCILVVCCDHATVKQRLVQLLSQKTKQMGVPNAFVKRVCIKYVEQDTLVQFYTSFIDW